MKLSIVTTLYCSGPYLREFHRRISSAAGAITDEYEILLVNDASPDDSLEIALELFEQDPHVRVIDLARNYRHLRAIMGGLAQCRGELVFLIDCDLEEPPEALAAFYTELVSRDADVVYGVQERRKGGALERSTGYLFYRLINALSPEPIPPNLVTARLMRRAYVDSLVAHREREIYLGGLFVITGFRQVAKVIHKSSTSRSTYTMRAKLSTAINAVTAFSNRPLLWVFNVGALLTATAGPWMTWILASQWITGSPPTLTTLLATLWFLGGLTILMLGIVAVYLSRVFTEVKRRPYVLVRRSWSHDEAAAERNVPERSPRQPVRA